MTVSQKVARVSLESLHPDAPESMDVILPAGCIPRILFAAFHWLGNFNGLAKGRVGGGGQALTISWVQSRQSERGPAVLRSLRSFAMITYKRASAVTCFDHPQSRQTKSIAAKPLPAFPAPPVGSFPTPRALLDRPLMPEASILEFHHLCRLIESGSILFPARIYSPVVIEDIFALRSYFRHHFLRNSGLQIGPDLPKS